ncbi:hypothetical protein J2Z40_000358 [Cytobacillus eiseniae]|uniref:Uncharacterized protein n=1 Tax=Cytobacillus eiseniae TaxID=762947 RepID=A0ABS4RBS4_9BACI|nr:hypothetical protein [Cytobacillus eiseniae]MBP2239805.1 hypothetical protein [Cytobacillus eiseniae]
MNNLFDKLKHKAKVTINQTAAKIKERAYSYAGVSSATVLEIADFIQKHSDTKVGKKHLLGFSFSFYQLSLEGVSYYLEMKGTYILQVDVQAPNETIVQYRSYRDKYSLQTPIRFPKEGK